MNSYKYLQKRAPRRGAIVTKPISIEKSKDFSKNIEKIVLFYIEVHINTYKNQQKPVKIDINL